MTAKPATLTNVQVMQYNLTKIDGNAVTSKLKRYLGDRGKSTKIAATTWQTPRESCSLETS